MNFTALEKRVFNLLVEEMRGNGLINTREIAIALKLPNDTVRGVLGSLAKKGKVECEPTYRHHGNSPALIWPVHPVIGACFWADSVSDDEICRQLIN